ncbi:MAG TPA: hypothetical protein VFS20_30405, partial [Longimicrobium sp.]|nr:hypothetical protein [Longimicrobium sp.]
MSDIQITFINNSNDANNSQVVIFQQNVATNYDEAMVAWRVIHATSGHSETFPFPYPVLGADLLQGAEPGKVIHTANLSEAAASFPLDGVTTADLVLSGG